MASTPDVAFPADQPSTGRALIPSHQLCSNESRIGSSVFNQSRMVRCVQLIAIPIYCFSTSSILEEKGCLRQSTYHASYAFLLLPAAKWRFTIRYYGEDEKLPVPEHQHLEIKDHKTCFSAGPLLSSCILSFLVAKLLLAYHNYEVEILATRLSMA